MTQRDLATFNKPKADRSVGDKGSEIDFSDSFWTALDHTVIGGGPVLGEEQIIDASVVLNRTGESVHVGDTSLLARLSIDITGFDESSLRLQLMNTDVGDPTRFIGFGGTPIDTTIVNGAIQIASSNQAPLIDSLIALPDPVKQGDQLTLTANNVIDADGSVANVEFFRDDNGDGIGQTNEKLGEDTNSDYGYSLTLSATWSGNHNYLAQTTDDDGATNTIVVTNGTVSDPSNQPPTIVSLSDGPDPVA